LCHGIITKYLIIWLIIRKMDALQPIQLYSLYKICACIVINNMIFPLWGWSSTIYINKFYLIWLDEKQKLYNYIILYVSDTVSPLYNIVVPVTWVYSWVLVLSWVLDPWVQVPVHRYSHRSESGQNNQGDSQVQIQVIHGSTCAHPYRGLP